MNKIRSPESVTVESYRAVRKIVVPKVGGDGEPPTLLEWKGKEGDSIQKGSVVLVAASGGNTHGVQAEASGYLHISLKEGRQTPIGSTSGFIAETRGNWRDCRRKVVSKQSVGKVLLGIPSKCMKV